MISLVELIKKALALYAANFKTIFRVLLLVLFWQIALAIVPLNLKNTIQFALPATLVSMIITAFTELALIKGFSSFIAGTPVRAMILLTAALKRLPWFILMLLGYAAALTAGLIFFIIPAVIFTVWFMFIGAVLMLEGVHGIPAFQKSRALTAGLFFPLLARVGTVVFAAIFVISAATQGVASILTAILGAANPTVSAATGIFSATLSVLFLPVVTGTIVILYFEAKKFQKQL